MFHAHGVLLRLLKRRAILDGRRIEHGDVGEHSFPEKATVLQAQVGRRQRAQPAHRFAQGNHLFLAHVFSEDTREVPVGARMRVRLQEDPGRRLRGFVGTEGNPRPGQFSLHVFFRHHEINAVDAGFIFCDQIHDGFNRILAAHSGHFREGLARERFEFFRLESDEQNSLR